MKRHHVLLGTKTTAGGEVISANSMRTLDGVALAVEGDKIYCPACKSTGIIRCQGPRLDETWNGANFALEHDLCICGCRKPPTLLANQDRSWQTLPSGNFAIDIADPASANHENNDLEHYFEIVYAETELPVEGMHYMLSSGGQALGQSDPLASGRSRVLSMKDHPHVSFVAWRKGGTR